MCSFWIFEVQNKINEEKDYKKALGLDLPPLVNTPSITSSQWTLLKYTRINVNNVKESIHIITDGRFFAYFENNG